MGEEAERLRGAEPWSSWIRGLIEREVEEASMTRAEWKEIFAEAGARVRAPYRSNPASQPGISTPTLGTMWREGEGDRAQAEAGIVDKLAACGVPRHIASEVVGREAIVLEWDDGWREVRLPARHWPELSQ